MSEPRQPTKAAVRPVEGFVVDQSEQARAWGLEHFRDSGRFRVCGYVWRARCGSAGALVFVFDQVDPAVGRWLMAVRQQLRGLPSLGSSVVLPPIERQEGVFHASH